MPKDAFSRLLEDDDIEPVDGQPTWETNGCWYFLVTPKGIAVVLIRPGEQGQGIVRFPDRSAVTLPPGSDKTVFEQAEGILHEGPPAWDRLERDFFDPNKVEKPKPVPIPEVVEETCRVPPKRHGLKSPFLWDFKK